MPGPRALPAVAAPSPPNRSVRMGVRLLAGCGALLGLILAPSLAQAGPAPALRNTVYTGVGYSTVQGSKGSYLVPVMDTSHGPPIPRFAPLHFGPAKPAAPKPKPLVVGKATDLRGTVTVTRNGKTRLLANGDPVQVGDTLSTDSTGSVRVVASTGFEFDDFGLSRNTKVEFDQQDYNEAHPAPTNFFVHLFQGASVWASEKIDNAHRKNDNVETPVGSLGFRGMNRVPSAPQPPLVGDRIPTGGPVTTHVAGSLPAGDVEWVGYQLVGAKNAQVATPVGNTAIRGTQFIDRYDPKTHVMEVDLISGTVSVKPKRARTAHTFTAPVQIRCTAARVTGSPLTLKQYEATKAALFSP